MNLFVIMYKLNQSEYRLHLPMAFLETTVKRVRHTNIYTINSTQLPQTMPLVNCKWFASAQIGEKIF